MRKVDQRIFDRIKQLRFVYQLSEEVIATRLGISKRTVRVYTRAARTNSTPYQPDVPLDPDRSPLE